MTAAAIRCQGLHKRFATRTGPLDAVDGLDLEVRVGECFGLLGPNGAGKTTTIEILEGLSAPTGGRVEILGQTWGSGNDPALRRRLGITLQETRLAEKLTVAETLALFRSFYEKGLTPADVLGQVELNEKAEAYVGKLSGGQKQRLAVACALVGDPELLFLDEPTTGLDPQSRRQLWDILKRFQRQGRTVLLTTHYMDEAERLCDRIAIVDRGKVIAIGSPAELIARLGGEHLIEFDLAEGQAADPDELRRLPAVTNAKKIAVGYLLACSQPHLALPALLNTLRERGLEMVRLSTRHASLEDVFVELTGHGLRDGD